jgi:hypothetical protein
MGVPSSGLILIPLTLGFFCFSSYIAEWAIFCSVLQGAALVNVGGGFVVGLSPYFFTTALIALRILPRWITGRCRFFVDEPAVAQVRMLLIFTIWCVFSAFALPILFEGLAVDSARAGVDQGYYVRSALHLSFSNVGQAGYMILDFVMVICLLESAARPGRLDRLARAFSCSGALVAAVGTYQIICNHLGLPFPSWLFNSNEAWAQGSNQLIGPGFSRISATFVEPSDAAGFLAVWSVFELSLAISSGPRTGWHWLCATVGSLMLVETASSTGYITAGIMWLVMAYDCGGTILRQGWIKVKPSLAVLGLASAVLVSLTLVPTARPLLDAVLFSKGASESAIHRTSTLSRAVEVFEYSWGLGVGLGSNRAMSVFFYVLSNLGFPGMLLILFLLTQLLSQVRLRLCRPGVDSGTRRLLTALGGAFAADMLALLASGAEITQPRLWILWGLLLATIRHDWLAERQSLRGAVSALLVRGRSSRRGDTLESSRGVVSRNSCAVLV